MGDILNLIAKRGRIKGTLTRLFNYTLTINQETTIDDVLTRIEKLDEAWRDFELVEDQLMLIPNQISERVEFEEKYFKTKSVLRRTERDLKLQIDYGAHFNTTIDQLVEQQKSFIAEVSGINRHTNEVRLPRLNIPRFGGDFKEWPSFQDLYIASVHNSHSLSNVQKFQYLKGLLQNEAAALINHIPVTEYNYIEAWKKLVARYDKKKYIIHSFLKTFFDQPSISQCSSTNLRKLSDTSDEILRGLNALGTHATARDPWIVYILMSKLDTESRQMWSNESTEIEFPTIIQFQKFLTKRCDALESANIHQRKPICHQSKPISSIKNLVSTSTTCFKCNGDHVLYSCPDFIAMDISTRREFVSQNSLCFNCLRGKHPSFNCFSKSSCRRCSKKHHTLLHLNSQHQQHQQHSTTPSTSTTTSNTVNSLLTNSNQHVSQQQIQLQHEEVAVKNPISQCHSTINTHAPVNTLNSSSTYQQNTQTPINPLNCSSTNTPSIDIPVGPVASTNLCSKLQCNINSLLPTVLVLVKDTSGVNIMLRGLLDSGSQASFITESSVQRLSLPRTNARIPVSGLASTGAGITKGQVSLKISSRLKPFQSISMHALILPHLTTSLPTSSFNTDDWEHIKNLPLSDPSFNESSPIDLIIGANVIFDIFTEGEIKRSNGKPLAKNTIFGWVLAGEMPCQSTALNTFHSIAESFVDIDRSLKRFWETEELLSTKPLTEEDSFCENNFAKTYKRTDSGKFMVKLPFKNNTDKLGNSLNAAIVRMKAMERKFQSNDQLRHDYIEFMRDYENMGHMIPLSKPELSLPEYCGFYLPHHAITKDSTTTKLRVVFDASAKSSTGISLNDKLLVGPSIQSSLYSILLRFRTHKFVFTADVAKMYRQILVSDEDSYYQLIVWRENSNLPLKYYKLLTVTYGTAPAPFLATRVLKQLSIDTQLKYPKVSEIIEKDFYMDDLMSGTNDIQEAKDLCHQISSVLGSGGFQLRKWSSNCSEILSNFPKVDVELSPYPIHEESKSIKILGLQWFPKEDCFSYKVQFSPEFYPQTKRNFLSESSKVFDPLGLLTPAIINIKIIFQQLWLEKINWDDSLPDTILKQWLELRKDFSSFSELRIPRCIEISTDTLELHGFCDASQDAYAAAIFSKCYDFDGNVKINLVTAKSKVCPIKQVSIPKLELCGAVLLTRLMKSVQNSLSYSITKIHAWTDSNIVLAWLTNHPRKWNTYVANRVSEILDFWGRDQWQYVPSAQNPADCASRGLSPSHLINFDLWWHGPHWLYLTPDNWPSQEKVNLQIADVPEIRPIKIKGYTSTISNVIIQQLLIKFSSFTKINRIISYMLRFIHNCQNLKPRRSGFLTTSELNESKNLVILYVQRCVFASDIQQIESGRSLHKDSKLISLNPFLDKNGILRVGGRIQNAKVSYDYKHPVVLPKSHIFTEKIIDEAHLKYLHAGPTLLSNILKQRYWIIGCKHQVRKQIHRCIICFKEKRNVSEQLMGSLPAPRVQGFRAFVKSGVDYAGPIALKTHKGRGEKISKGYIAVFVCLSTKAVHLEAVSDMTSAAFIACLSRFMSRRGICSDIYCDNGSNFIGAKRELADLYSNLQNNNYNKLISDFLIQDGTNWHMIPPAAPHVGGIWESVVKSAKFHLRRILHQSTLTYEEFSTLLSQIEAVLNSRPLCPKDTDELDPLTPAHFLIGQPTTLIPEPDLTEIKIGRLSRWQMVQQMTQSFWRRWHHEYLHTLQQRLKWQVKAVNVELNDLVIIREDNMPPAKWLTGRVIELHPGHDGLVRVVSIKTRNGSCKRPITKICKLPIS